MMLRSRITKCLLALVALLLAAAGGQGETSPAHFLPLTPGTYWLYSGTVTWYDADGDKEASATVSWKMTVESVVHTADFTAAVVTGYPGDLNWSNGDVSPKPTLLVESSDRKIYLMALVSVMDLAKTDDDPASFKKFMQEDNLLFQWPLKKGQRFCDEEGKQRDDGHYCWVIASQAHKRLGAVKGISSASPEVFLLQYVTNPDDEQIELVAGVGIVSYQYHHHGTTADTELKLLEFHPASEKSSSIGATP